MATYKREIVVLKYSYGYYKDRGVFAIFILVSVPIGFVTGGLSGSPWRTFEFWSGLTKSLLFNATWCSTIKIQKSKKENMC